MKLSQLFSQNKRLLSFEVFPPKTSTTFEAVKSATLEIASLNPSYMSVTYGAGGTTKGYTSSVAKEILNHGVTPLEHLTCVGSSKESILEFLEELKLNGIENILALRGDIPKDATQQDIDNWYFKYASDLTSFIKEHGDFCVGGACYPEGHIECENQTKDIENLKIKVDAGCEFLTTQMFFDNNILYKFLYKIREAGITVPVVAGIMPVTNAKQIKRILSISDSHLPQKFVNMLDRFGSNDDAMKQAGIAYATEQIVDLYANGINAVHVYSMNKPDVAEKIQNNLSDILG